MKFYQRDPSGFFLTSRPSEASSFDPFIKQAEPIAFPDQAFESFSVASAEKKQDLLLKRIQMELFL